MSAARHPKAIVIGAGLGGLAAAARLAKSGYSVTVVEKQATVGGRACRLEQDGYQFDAGPTILLMVEVLEQLFADCGQQMRDYVKLVPLDPNYRVFFTDGRRLTMSGNLPELVGNLAAIDPAAPQQFYRYFDRLADMYRLSRQQFIDKNFNKLTDFISPAAAAGLVRRRGLTNLYRFVSRYFADERLRMAFSFQSMYLGVSPFEAPAIYAIVAYMETGLGVYYAQGGMVAIPQALAKLVGELGGTVRTGTSVERILAKDGTVRGVLLENGQRLSADVVVSNADLPYTYSKLLRAEARPHFSDRRLSRLRHASSAVLFFWGVDDELAGLLHHNIFFTGNYKRNLEQIFRDNAVPTDPSFYVHVPTRTDPTLAPSGKHAVSVLVPVPNLSAAINWDEAAARLRELVLARLQRELGVMITDHLETEALITPHDFADRFNLTRGSAFGLSHHFFQSGYFRPHNYVRGTRGLYLVGASTYPGSGVPMVLLSGKLVAERILADAQKG